MRFLLFLTLLGGLAFSSFQPANAQQHDQQQITALMTAQTTAWNKGDIDGFMQTYWHSDSLLFIGKNGVTYGWQATLERYKKTYPDVTAMGKLDFKLLEFKPLAADVYLLIGQWHLQRTIGDLQGHFSLVLKKIKGQWKIIADHSS
ncbi:YybH family protein [Chitinophaga eiseniae]|uniref:Nuclear transport factor 2 family protein n=1 Tax=Chitinophaga eiseniae TaxID=634771 RepID=A0A847SNT4_9BACT|nr:nuclear transport factor 2 family protein [Chitinophaga eiseniae]NLR78899.1 nuclear transport factor 2 family protein [Chitinophaga eiseniae]